VPLNLDAVKVLARNQNLGVDMPLGPKGDVKPVLRYWRRQEKRTGIRTEPNFVKLF